jgi:hypothetical protein
MKEEFVSHEIAKKLKEKEFKEKCVAYYYPSGYELVFNQTAFRGAIVEDCLYSYNSLPVECFGSELIDAPTIHQVLKWLRKEKHTYIYVDVCKEGWFFEVKCLRSFYMINTVFFDKHKSYEEAALAGIEYVIDNLI